MATTFGDLNIGTTDDTQSADTKEGCAFVCGSSGLLTKITARLSGLGPGVGAQTLRAIVYLDSAASPVALVGYSVDATIADAAPYGWVDFVFPGLPPVTGGVTYWLCLIGGPPQDGSQIRAFANGTVKFNADTYADGPSNPFGAPSTVPSFHYSIYATVTAGARRSRISNRGGVRVGRPGRTSLLDPP